MKVYLYANKAKTRFTAVAVTDDAGQVLRLIENKVGDTDWRLGELVRDCLAGLPDAPPPKDYYETAGGGLTSAVGHLWEIDKLLDKVAIFWVR